ncbi:acylphosphatase [Candidatus Pacearchaeota archaeon]|nr:acylphosphatase [Candidatus Pacearchaeota archaeon]
MVSYKINLKGRVQGVSFRSFTNINAIRLGLKGYVKNLSDGSVEIVVSGKKEKIDMLLGILRKGNGYCEVDDIVISDANETGFENFSIY